MQHTPGGSFSPSPATHQKRRMSSLHDKTRKAGLQHAQGGSFFTITSNTLEKENVFVAWQDPGSQHVARSKRKLFYHHQQHTRKGKCLHCMTRPGKLACNMLKEEAFSPSPATHQIKENIFTARQAWVEAVPSQQKGKHFCYMTSLSKCGLKFSHS